MSDRAVSARCWCAGAPDRADAAGGSYPTSRQSSGGGRAALSRARARISSRIWRSSRGLGSYRVQPASTVTGIALYYYPRKTLPLIRQYIAEGNNPDQPGRLIQWLYPRTPVYTWPVPGLW